MGILIIFRHAIFLIFQNLTRLIFFYQTTRNFVHWFIGSGTKHIDPDTGLIYFKYDFGYEFGILLPGEGKKTVSSSSKTIQEKRRASDIDVPIVHEFTNKKENGFSKPAPSTPTHYGRPANVKQERFTPAKTVKWEPTSESEYSESEDLKSRRKNGGGLQTPPSIFIPASPSPRWDPMTPSPVSLSPSLPSLSPRHSSACTGPPSNIDSSGISFLSGLCTRSIAR